MSKDAEITVGANADAATRAAAVLKSAWVEAGHAMASAIGSAAQSTISSLGEVALAQGRVNFSSQHADVRAFEASSARMAVSMGRDLEGIRGGIERTGVAIGKRPGEVATWAAEVRKLTHNATDAYEGLNGIAGLAAQTGESVDDYKGLAAELVNVGKVGGDTTHVIGSLAGQAELLGTTGGVSAFASQVEGLSDTISHFAVSSEADFLKVTAAAAVLGRGLSDAASKRVQQSALGSIASDPSGWSRYLGRDISDENGQVKDPAKVLQQITEKIKGTYGKDARRMLQLQFGAETGAALYKADWNQVSAAANVAPSGAPAKALDKYLGTDAGKRDVADAGLSVASRDLSGSATLLGRAADALQRFASHNPITSTLVSTALGTGSAAFMSGLGGKLSTLMGGKGDGGAVGGIYDLATKGRGGLGALGKIGAAGAALGSVAYAYSEISGAVDELGGGHAVGNDLSDFLSGRGPAGAKGNRNNAALEEQNKKNLALAREKAARTATGTGAAGAGVLDPIALGGPGTPGTPMKVDFDYTKLAAALKDSVKVDITTAPENPVTASISGSQSGAAGNQG